LDLTKIMNFMLSSAVDLASVCHIVNLTFDMSGDRRQAKLAGGRPLDGGVRCLAVDGEGLGHWLIRHGARRHAPASSALTDGS
jgi:hypothetical protein